jgi:hypothetical protein
MLFALKGTNHVRSDVVRPRILSRIQLQQIKQTIPIAAIIGSRHNRFQS